MGASRGSASIYRVTTEGHSVTLGRGDRIRIGRHPENELVLEDTSVSRFHARIEWPRRSGAPFVVDLGSSNGTYVDGACRLRASLGEVATVAVGEVQLSVVLEVALVSSSPTSPTTQGQPVDSRCPDSRGYLRAAEGVHALLFELERSRRTASLLLSDGRFQARVVFVGGRIVDAHASGARGVDALQVLLTRPKGGQYSVTRRVELELGDLVALPPLHEVRARLTALAG